MVVRLCSTKPFPREVMIATESPLIRRRGMDRRDCMCLFILTLISHLITGQESWMVYLNHISLTVQFY